MLKASHCLQKASEDSKYLPAFALSKPGLAPKEVKN